MEAAYPVHAAAVRRRGRLRRALEQTAVPSRRARSDLRPRRRRPSGPEP